jgi:hypothetical protein
VPDRYGTETIPSRTTITALGLIAALIIGGSLAGLLSIINSQEREAIAIYALASSTVGGLVTALFAFIASQRRSSQVRRARLLSAELRDYANMGMPESPELWQLLDVGREYRDRLIASGDIDEANAVEESINAALQSVRQSPPKTG